jgi:conjugal transfer mating pair stabilization protein TraN
MKPWRILRALLWVALVFGGAVSHAQTCKKVGTTCVQGAETRMINGVSLTRDCWQFQDTYECFEADAVDTCAPLRNILGCFELTANCVEKNYAGTCIRFDTTMRCDHLESTPAGAKALTPVYTIQKNELIPSQLCGKLAADSNCTKTGRVCVQPAGTRNINGLNVYKDCWQYEDQYTCVDPISISSTCDAFSTNSKCTLTGSKCTYILPGGQCGNTEKTYSCETKAASTSAQQICKNMACDANGVCIPSVDQADKDFGNVAASMELSRQIAVYTNPNSIEIFNGESAECSKGKLGVKSCCSPKAGGANNNQVVTSLVSGAASIGKELADIGSYYVYDSLMSSETLQQGMGAMISTVNNWFTPNGASEGAEFFNGKFDPSFSYMGFTASFGAASASTGSILLGNVGGTYFSFNPYMLAAQIAINWIMTCNASDGMTAMRKGQNLCHHVGTYCASKFLGSCTESKESYCCYNSRLARIVQEQGRAQLGKSWGVAQSPQCNGFSQSEFERLDFAKMDLSEFVAEIQAKAINTIPGTTRAVQNVGAKVTNYFGSAPSSSLYIPSNSSGNLHPTATGNALNKATSSPPK